MADSDVDRDAGIRAPFDHVVDAVDARLEARDIDVAGMIADLDAQVIATVDVRGRVEEAEANAPQAVPVGMGNDTIAHPHIRRSERGDHFLPGRARASDARKSDQNLYRYRRLAAGRNGNGRAENRSKQESEKKGPSSGDHSRSSPITTGNGCRLDTATSG